MTKIVKFEFSIYVQQQQQELTDGVEGVSSFLLDVEIARAESQQRRLERGDDLRLVDPVVAGQDVPEHAEQHQLGHVEDGRHVGQLIRRQQQLLRIFARLCRTQN